MPGILMGIDSSGRLRSGLERAAGAGMLIAGSLEADGFKRLLMGPVGTQVTRHACCPVVVIPADRA